MGSLDDLPRTFGDYTLIKPLGRGGMGQVFQARLQARGLAGVDKICVVKTLRPTMDPEYERRFVDEARLIVLLTHKNICPVFDAGCFEGEYYLAMEHIAGREVRQLQVACETRGTPLPIAMVIHVIKEALEALDGAHRMVHPLTKEPLRVVHRDVSPQNVMISEEGEVKLIDFGLAVSSQKLERTAPQIVMGKMAYMAPEHARGEVVDARADQFAAGVMLYELLTNSRYYGALPIDAIWRTVGSGGHVAERLFTLDDDLQQVIRRATAADREQRYQTCGDMRDALTAIELKRGAIAGSREVRAALQHLDSAVVLPPPAPALAPTPAEPPPEPAIQRERTRTFRIVAADPGAWTESGVVVEQRAPTSRPPGDAPRLGAPDPMSSPIPVGVPSATAARPTEATIVVRHINIPTRPIQSRRGAVVIGGALAVLLGCAGIAAIWSGGAPDLDVAISRAPGDVPEPPPVVAPPAPARDGVVTGDTVVSDADAGVIAGPDEPNGAAVGVADSTAVNDVMPITSVKRPPSPVLKRKLPAFPSGPNGFLRLNYLNEHCPDLPCTGEVRQLLNDLNKVSNAKIEEKAADCHRTCEQTPRR